MGPVHAAIVALLRQRPEILLELIAARSELCFAGPPELLPPEVWAVIRPKPKPPLVTMLSESESAGPEDELGLALDDRDELDMSELDGFELVEARLASPEPQPEAQEPRRRVTVREYRADLVLRVATTSKRYPELSITAEVQTLAITGKIVRWLDYGTLYRLRLGPHLCLVFIATTRYLAQWFRDFVLPELITERVFLIAPEDTPDWLECAPAEDPRRVLLAALMRGPEDDGALLVERALEAIGHVEDETDRELYYEALLSALGKEKIMKTLENHRPQGSSRFYSWDDYIPNEVELNSYLHVTGLERGEARGLERGREEGREEGIERGRKTSLFDVLVARGLPLDEATRERIEQCHDLDQLARWLRRALTIETLEQLFEAQA